MTAPVIPPPQDLDAERSVLAALILGADTPALAPEAFYRTAHQQIYRAILAMRSAGTPVDVVTLGAELRQRGDLDAVGGPAALADILGYAATTTNTEHHARIVQDAHSRRLTRDAAQRLLAASVDPAIEPAAAWDRMDAEREAIHATRAERAGVTYLDLTVPAPPIEWIVPGWLARREIAVLASSAGSGKSTTFADLCVAVATGRPWCSTLQIAAGQTGRVIYFDEEQGPEEVSRLFQRLHGCQPCPGLYVASMQGIVLGTPAGQARIEAAIAEHLPILVGFDTAAQVFAGIDLNDLEAVSGVFRFLFHLRDTYGVTVVILTHYRKAIKDESDLMALERVFGSVGFGGNPSTVWTAARQDGQALEIRQVKRRGARTQKIRVEYQENEIGEITLTAESLEAAEDAKDRAEGFIVTAMRGHATSRTGELMAAAEAAGFPRRTAERAMNQLVVVGRVENVSRGVWRLAGGTSANVSANVDFDLAEEGDASSQVVDTQW